ncbi:MAG: hypothetical protein ACYC2O_09265 [Microthrixaceae bacterium]
MTSMTTWHEPSDGVGSERAHGRRRWGWAAFVVLAVLAGACGGASDDEAGSGVDESPAEASGSEGSGDRPPEDIPVAPDGNLEIDDPEALGTRRAAVEPGQWFEFEYGYSARISSVRAAKAGEVQTEAEGGGASIVTIQVHYDGDEPTSDYTFFQLDTSLFNQAYCVDEGAGYGPITMEKGETVEVPYCVHLEDRGNGVELLSYPGSSQSWGAWYAIIGPEGVIESDAAPPTSARPGF